MTGVQTCALPILGADEKEIYFTACGTESDNWAIFGTADAKKGKGKHIITSKIEHHAVLHSCQQLEKQGYDVTYLDVEPDGTINPQALKAALRDDRIVEIRNNIYRCYFKSALAAMTRTHPISRYSRTSPASRTSPMALITSKIGRASCRERV